MANFQKNYEEFYRGYTPDVKSFKKYAEIQKNMSQSNSETIDIDQMKKFYFALLNNN